MESTPEDIIRIRKARLIELRRKAKETIELIGNMKHEIYVNGDAPEVLEHCTLAKEELVKLKNKLNDTGRE